MHLININICFLIAFASTSSQQCTDEQQGRIGQFVELKQNATFEVIQEFKTSSNTTIAGNTTTAENSTTAENTTKDQEALYSDIAASLNITESDNGRSDFVRALDVITDSYFKACYAPDCKKLTPTDGHQLVVELISLLENLTETTDFTLMRQIYGKLLCLQEFDVAATSKRATDFAECAQAESIMELYICLDPDEISCIFNISPKLTCESEPAEKFRGNCLAFVVDTTGSMSEEIESVKEVIASFIKSEENTLTLCYILVAFNDFDYPLSDAEKNLEFAKIYSSDNQIDPPPFSVFDGANMVDVHPVSELLTDVDSLAANGGGDCPEFGMTGIKKAIDLLGGFEKPSIAFKIGKHNIIVLTDASAKDYSLNGSIITQIESSKLDITVHLFYSGTGCGDSFGAYSSIASATGGFIVSQINAQSFPDFVEFVKISSESKKRSVSLCKSFVISQFVSQFTTLITTEQSMVTFTAPDGTTSVVDKSGKSFDIHTVSDPQTGDWTACVSTGTIELSINKEVNLEFSIEYLEVDSAGQLLPTCYLPTICETRVFILHIIQQQYISFNHSLYIDYVDNDGQILASANITKCQGMLNGSVTLPSQDGVRYQIRGYDTKGNEFSHTNNELVTLNIDAPTINVITATNASIIVNPGKQTIVWLLIKNNNNLPFYYVSTQIIVPPDFNVSIQSDSLFSLQSNESLLFQFSIMASSSLSAGTPFNINFTVDNNCVIKSSFFLAYVRPSVPFQISKKTTSSIVFTWTEPIVSDGNVATYTLLFETTRSSDVIGTSKEVDNQTSSYILNDLYPYELIYFTIIAKDANGTEVAGSGPIAVRTSESEPSRVTSLKFEVISSTSATISWSEPTDKNGVLLYYAIIVEGSDDYFEIFNVTYTVLNISLSELNEYVRYEVSVIAATSAGEGDELTILFYTAEGVPIGSPTNVHYTVLSSTSLSLSWSPPLFNHRRGFITEYIIVVSDTLAADSELVYTLPHNHTHLIVLDLTEFGVFSVSLVAATSAGEGSAIILEASIVTGVPSLPLNVSGEMFNDTAVALEWQNPARPNGIVQGFIIYYIYELTEEMDGSSNESILHVPRDTTSKIIDNLNSQKQYMFKIAAENQAGIGEVAIVNVTLLSRENNYPAIAAFTVVGILVFIIIMTIVIVAVVVTVVYFFNQKNKRNSHPFYRDKPADIPLKVATSLEITS